MEQKTAEDKIIEVFKKYSKSVDTEYNVYNCLIEEDWSNIAQGVVKLLRWMQEQDKWIELKNEPNEVPEMDCYFYNETVGVVFIPKDEYVKIGFYTHYCPVTLPSPPKTK